MLQNDCSFQFFETSYEPKSKHFNRLLDSRQSAFHTKYLNYLQNMQSVPRHENHKVLWVVLYFELVCGTTSGKNPFISLALVHEWSAQCEGTEFSS